MSKAHSTPIAGDKFGRWIIASPLVRHNSRDYFECRCDCGTIKLVRKSKLLDGTSRSCGCLRNDNLTTHGATKNNIRRESHEYWIWNTIVQRCTNPKVKNWMDYGGRGITVCDRWLKYENFIADMGKRPTAEHSIDRDDNEAGYSPENCRWATRQEQATNKRNNHLIELFGRCQHLAGWAREYGIDHTLIISRLSRGWSEVDAVTKPPRKIKKKETNKCNQQPISPPA
jgi:hypothetical protein